MVMPKTFGQNGVYEVNSILGQGGFAIVYKARHKFLQRDVAIKVLRSEVVEGEGGRERFEIEARAVTRLSGHPNIVTVYDYGDDGSGPYLVLRFVDGEPLDKRLNRGISIREIDTIVRGLASALDHAHSLQLVHRDIKPSNVLLEEDGTPILTDFGIAKLLDAQTSVTRTLIGTPDYMSPEQCSGAPLDGRSDIYSLGVLLYRIFTGALPFTGAHYAILHQHITAPPPPMAGHGRPIPPGVEDVVFWALAKQPDDRPATAGILARELSRVLRPRILVEEARVALDKDDLDLAGNLVDQLRRDHPSYPEGALVEREMARRRAAIHHRNRIAGMVANEQWQLALAEIDRLGLRSDPSPSMASLVGAAETGQAAEQARQEAARRAEDERRAREVAERDRQAREAAERDRQAREAEERDRQAREAAERERIRLAREAEERERARLAREAEARERARREAEERDRLAREAEARARARRQFDEGRRQDADDRAGRDAAERQTVFGQSPYADRRTPPPRTPTPLGVSQPSSGTPFPGVAAGRLPTPPAPRPLDAGTPVPLAPRPIEQPARTGSRSRVLAIALIAAAVIAGVIAVPTVLLPDRTPAKPTAPVVIVPPTAAPATLPPTAAPATAPATAPPATPAPATATRVAAAATLAPTPVPPTPAPATAVPPTAVPPTAVLPTAVPATAAPTLPPRVTGRDGAELALVPGGPFVMGNDFDAGLTRHTLTLPDVYVDLTEVTNARFARFVQEAGHQTQGDWRYFAESKNFPSPTFDPNRDDHPVVNVSWNDAVAYCRWAGRRLPTEPEWEKAARGTDGVRWPWGEQPDPARANPRRANIFAFEDDHEPDTMTVGKFPAGASPYGLVDMVGNVREWTDSSLQPYPLAPQAASPDAATSRVVRGGSWLPSDIDVTHRLAEPTGTVAKDLGFRCAVSADQIPRR